MINPEDILKNMRDPDSELRQHMKKYMAEQVERIERKQLRAAAMYEQVQTCEDLSAFFSNLSQEDLFIAHLMAEMYGQQLTEDLLGKLDEEWTHEAYYFKGFIFGIDCGQGSVAWYTEWDSDKLASEPLV